MKKIRIGQIGIGHNHASAKMAALRQLPELFEIVGIAETDPRWLKERGGKEEYKDLPFMSEEELFRIPGLEAVAVETDGPQLLPTALRCADRVLLLHEGRMAGFGEPAALLDEDMVFRLYGVRARRLSVASGRGAVHVFVP